MQPHVPMRLGTYSNTSLAVVVAIPYARYQFRLRSCLSAKVQTHAPYRQHSHRQKETVIIVPAAVRMEGGVAAGQLQQEVEELRHVLEVSRLQLEDLTSACRLLVQAITAQHHYNQTKGVQLKKKRRKYVSCSGY